MNSRCLRSSLRATAAALILLPVLAAAQALPGLSSLRVAYNTRKATANPQGELKAQLDAVDKAIVAATRAGDAGEARRQLAKGMALLAGDAWTPALDYRNSLLIRSARTIVDSSEPYAARLGLAVHKGLDERLRALEAGAAAAPEAVRADIRYPGDFIRNVNRGRVGRGTFDAAMELRAAETVLAAVKKGEDPYRGRTGGMERHYLLEGAGEVMPYRVHVPAAYRAATPTPLVIALHGLGGNEDAFFDAYDGAAVRLAEQHGFLLAAPLGYRVDGFYGAAMGGAPDAATRRRLELSERDVLEVVRRMRDDYNVDARRIYLIGHSMGAIGTWHLAAKYPDLWAAVGPFSGTGSPAAVASMKGIPQIVVHGDADPTVNVAGSRNMVAEMKRLGVPVTYIEVPGGNHSDVVVPNLPKVFEFPAAQRKEAAVPSVK